MDRRELLRGAVSMGAVAALAPASQFLAAIGGKRQEIQRFEMMGSLIGTLSTVDPDGMNLEPFRANPVVLFNHDQTQVIGYARRILSGSGGTRDGIWDHLGAEIEPTEGFEFLKGAKNLQLSWCVRVLDASPPPHVWTHPLGGRIEMGRMLIHKSELLYLSLVPRRESNVR